MTAKEKINAFSDEFERMPGVTVIHEFDGFKPVFMTKNGLALLNLSLEELIAIKENYPKLFFNRNFMDDFLEKLSEMIESDGNNETYTFFHQVKIEEKFKWYAASLKVFHSEPTHTITYAVPLEGHHWTMKRAQRLLEETEFAKKNLQKFSGLTQREREVLALAAKGKRTLEMAENLNISSDTINSHLKAVKKKLEITTTFELTEFALAYDL